MLFEYAVVAGSSAGYSPVVAGGVGDGEYCGH